MFGEIKSWECEGSRGNGEGRLGWRQRLLGGGWIQKAKIKPTQPSWSLAELGNIFKIGIVSWSVLTELIESVSHILDWFPQVPDWSPQVPDCVPQVPDCVPLRDSL